MQGATAEMAVTIYPRMCHGHKLPGLFFVRTISDAVTPRRQMRTVTGLLILYIKQLRRTNRDISEKYPGEFLIFRGRGSAPTSNLQHPTSREDPNLKVQF